ncbi:hypothetical protein SDC9_120183 [bioreactor metagenome]|uniref:Uncharacterized protein n=1 Tax=bioreactor metagenome TaxID=1076179 RepID=A0A645C7N4_9ZZZZ
MYQRRRVEHLDAEGHRQGIFRRHAASFRRREAEYRAQPFAAGAEGVFHRFKEFRRRLLGPQPGGVGDVAVNERAARREFFFYGLQPRLIHHFLPPLP